MCVENGGCETPIHDHGTTLDTIPGEEGEQNTNTMGLVLCSGLQLIAYAGCMERSLQEL